MMMRVARLAILLLLSVSLSACSGPPYVYNAAAYDRSNPNFGKPLTDRDSVSICYSTRGATPDEVVKLARRECGAFGKTAVYQHQTYDLCPMSNPVAAVFTCEKPASTAGGS